MHQYTPRSVIRSYRTARVSERLFCFCILLGDPDIGDRFSETLTIWMPSFWKHRLTCSTGILACVLVRGLVSFQAQPSAVVPAGPLPPSETLQYNVEWRLITAGKMRMSFVAAGAAGFQANIHLESAGLVSKLFKVEDEYSAVLDQGLCARSSFFKTHEGKRQRETRIAFDPERKKASYLERDTVKNTVVLAQDIDIPACVCDIAGGLYRMRTLNLEPGQTAQVPISDGKKSALVRVDSQRIETIKTPGGVFRAIRYEAFLFNNVVYRRSGRAYIWLTNDRRRLPVQIQVHLQLAIGTITLQLEKEDT
jgi:hypothetical protein